MDNELTTEELLEKAAWWLDQAEGSGRACMEEGSAWHRRDLGDHAAQCASISQAYSALAQARLARM